MSSVGLTEEELQSFSQIYIAACGSALSCRCGMPACAGGSWRAVRVDLASEFRYRSMPSDPNGLVIVISQSGEMQTALQPPSCEKEGAENPWNCQCGGAPLPGKQIMYFIPLLSGDCSCHNESLQHPADRHYCFAVQFALVRDVFPDANRSYSVSAFLSNRRSWTTRSGSRFAAKQAKCQNMCFSSTT